MFTVNSLSVPAVKSVPQYIYYIKLLCRRLSRMLAASARNDKCGRSPGGRTRGWGYSQTAPLQVSASVYLLSGVDYNDYQVSALVYFLYDCLEVVRGVEVTVEQHHAIGRYHIHSQGPHTPDTFLQSQCPRIFTNKSLCTEHFTIYKSPYRGLLRMCACTWERGVLELAISSLV